MLQLEQQMALAENPLFHRRIIPALYQVAHEIFDEGPEVAGHPLRYGFARSVIMNDVPLLVKYSHTLASHPSIVSLEFNSPLEIPDKDILDAVRDAWNPLSGYAPNDNGE